MSGKRFIFFFFLMYNLVGQAQKTVQILSTDSAKIDFVLEYKNVVIPSVQNIISLTSHQFQKLKKKKIRFQNDHRELVSGVYDEKDYIILRILSPSFFNRIYWLPDILLENPTLDEVCKMESKLTLALKARRNPLH